MILTQPSFDQAELIELANDAIILTDPQGTIIYWNRGACRIYGWERETVLGQNVHTLLQTEFSGEARNLDSILAREAHWEGELNQVRRDGHRIRVSSRWTIAQGDPASPRLQINSDITGCQEREVTFHEREEPLSPTRAPTISRPI